MNRIQVIGQAITSTNYATDRLFNFKPEPIREAAESFLAAGVSEMEIPEGVLDPEGRCRETGIDREALRRTIAGMPRESRMIGTYFGPPQPGKTEEFLKAKQRTVDHLVEHFPHFTYGMLHPPGKAAGADDIRATMEAWAELAQYAAKRKSGLQLCLHNHYDGSCETADQLRAYLDELRRVAVPNLRWGPDTGHCSGAGDQYLPIFEANADLIGDFFHLKARVPAFDQVHGGAQYAAQRDIWGSKAEKGRGLYGGFVNAADPEIETPFKAVFDLIRRKARPSQGLVRGAMEIDNPRQHPRLEVLCGVLYLKCVHGVTAPMDLSYEQIVQRVFRAAGASPG